MVTLFFGDFSERFDFLLGEVLCPVQDEVYVFLAQLVDVVGGDWVKVHKVVEEDVFRPCDKAECLTELFLGYLG